MSDAQTNGNASGAAPAAPEAAIETFALARNFGEICAVDHISLSVPRGKSGDFNRRVVAGEASLR